MRRLADAAIVMALAVGTFVFLEARVAVAAPVAEDAAILFRYALNLAAGDGLRWNPDGPTVSGASDLLFVGVVALVAQGPFSIEWAARAVGAAAHVATVIAVYLALARLFKQPRGLAVAAALFVLFSPAWTYVAAGFGTTLFALVAVAAWCAMVRSLRSPHPRDAQIFGASLILLLITRPDGTVLASAMWLGYAIARGVDRVAVVSAVTFAAGAATLALGRWTYFGDILPPTVVKWTWPDSVASAIALQRGAFAMWPALLTVPLVLWSRRREAWAFAIPAIAFTAFWAFIYDDQNFNSRYQYALTPIALLAWPLWTDAVRTRVVDLRRFKPFAYAAAVVAVVIGASLAVWHQARRVYQVPVEDGRYAVARELSAFSGRGLRMAVTDAGILSFASGWSSTIDLVGLNDAAIARDGVRAEYLAAHAPAVIEFTTQCESSTDRAFELGWHGMTRRIRQFVTDHNYIHAAAYGRDALWVQHYYVRPSLRDSQALVSALRDVPFALPGTGERARNLVIDNAVQWGPCPPLP
ncbi:MAG TPA: glycosyltransferase family 39 protein [Vicinamibacterales bacterium]|nr:glycosyltransferase family 39 protein [Vicinamibacterales bacterium]